MSFQRKMQWSVLFLIFFPAICFGDEIPSTTMGDVANNLLQPTMIVLSTMQFVYLFVGLSFMTASVIKYFEYRINPLSVTIGHIIFLLIVGIAFVSFHYYFDFHQALDSVFSS